MSEGTPSGENIMALGAVLLSTLLAVLGTALFWASFGFHAVIGIVAYVALGMLALFSFALIRGRVSADDEHLDR